ncbi:MAG: TetR/AcrR family transcriptional regulator [Cytophagales bacterium]|nr:TetR/AcrR family transcriptional regulator [Cytophagales bacterium]
METKERIIEGSMELFFKYGVRSVTMDMIASHLGISKKTLYENVKDKNTLVEMMAQHHFDQEQHDLEKLSNTTENAIDEIHQIAVQMKQMIRQINPILFFDIKRYYPKVWQLFDSQKYDCIGGYIINNLERGIKEGYYRPDLDVKVMMIFKMNQVEWAFDTDFFPITEFNLLDVQMQLFEHFIRGIVTKKGLELFEKYKEHEAN